MLCFIIFILQIEDRFALLIDRNQINFLQIKIRSIDIKIKLKNVKIRIRFSINFYIFKLNILNWSFTINNVKSDLLNLSV